MLLLRNHTTNLKFKDYDILVQLMYFSVGYLVDPKNVPFNFIIPSKEIICIKTHKSFIDHDKIDNNF